MSERIRVLKFKVFLAAERLSSPSSLSLSLVLIPRALARFSTLNYSLKNAADVANRFIGIRKKKDSTAPFYPSNYFIG